MNKMYLDDERLPKTEGWTVVRSVYDAKVFIKRFGLPDMISFDHDLGEDCETGYDLAKWLVQESLDGFIDLTKNFTYNVHSANPVGRDNIVGILDGYMKFIKQTRQSGPLRGQVGED